MLAAEKLHQFSRRFSSSNLFTIFGDVQTIGPSGLFRWSIEGGFGERLEEGPKRDRSCMLSRSRYSGDGHAWNLMSDMQLGSVWAGFVFLEGGFAKRGVTGLLTNEVINLVGFKILTQRRVFVHLAGPFVVSEHDTLGLSQALLDHKGCVPATK